MTFRSRLLAAVLGSLTAAGCASWPGPGGLEWDRTELTHQERRRPVTFAVPTARPASPALVIVLHGAVASGRVIARQSGFAELAADQGFVVAFPDGTGFAGLFRHWNAGFCCFRAHKKGVDDVGLVVRIADLAIDRYDVDPSRIYLAGFSNGGMLATAVAAAHPDRIAAVALVGAAVGLRPEPGGPIATPPRPAAPVPAILVHGLEDRRIPYAGGPPVGVGARDSFRWWADSNRASGGEAIEKRRDGAVVLDRVGDDRREVVLVSVAGLGHVWPSSRWAARQGSGELLGFDGTLVTWEFLRRHRVP